MEPTGGGVVDGLKLKGYQVQCATNSKFTKGKKTVTVKGYSAYSKKISKLKAKKKVLCSR